jgi:hypothetical protein
MATTIGPYGQGLVFLLGLPRSGTTLLSVMLDNHPDVVSPPEPWVMLALAELGKVSMRHPADSSLLAVAVDRFADQDDRIVAARAAGAALYQTHLRRHDASIFVDKTPRYALICDFLISVFPEARFIWLRRDPMDIAASYLTTWNVDLAEILAKDLDTPELFDLTIGLDRLFAFHERHADSLHIVHYEKLTAAAADELKSLSRHIGLEATDDMISKMTSFDCLRRNRDDFGDPKIHATSAPHVKSVGSWRNVLHAGQLQIMLDAIGVERMIRLGYASTVSELKARGIMQSDASAPSIYRAKAQRRWQEREEDIFKTTLSLSRPPNLAQARVHAALAGEEAWIAMANDAFEPERSALYERIAEEATRRAKAESEIDRLRAKLAERGMGISHLFRPGTVKRLALRIR